MKIKQIIRYFIPLLLLFFLLITGPLARAGITYHLSYNGKEIVMVGDAEKIDFGKVKQGEVCTAVLRIKNNSDDSLSIANIRGGCGLSVPAWPRRPIAPGEEATIQVRYDSNRPGVINRNLTINANTHSTVTILRVAGEIVPRN